MNPTYVLLYVENPLESARFYGSLLGREPVERSPTFALFVLESGVKLGLWGRAGVEPSATPVGGSELAFSEPNRDAVDARYRELRERGLRVAQEPTQLDFGYTFVVLDADGHRLRVFTPSE